LDDDEPVKLRRSVSSRVFLVGIAALMVWFIGYLVRDGWGVRIGRYRRDLRSAEISAVVIKNPDADGRNDRRAVPALYLTPDPSVSLDAPSDLQSTVDGRPAVRLFDLADPKMEEESSSATWRA
jgi:hypothetical protein